MTTTAPASNSIIELSDVLKRIGKAAILSDLNLTVREGDIHGFLGPNGAGKSTTIRVILGLWHATSGEVRVHGLDPRTHQPEVDRKTSYLAGDVALWPNLTGMQTLDVLGGLRGKELRDEGKERELIERLQLDPSKKVRAYSKGNRQKVALVAAFAARTPLLVLDEPTSGLDPLMERVFGELVTEAAAAGRTVLLSSHDLAEVDRICQSVSIIRDGTVVESGRLADLRHLAALTVTAPGVPPQVADRIGRARGVEKRSESTWSVPSEEVPTVLRALADAGLTSVTCQPASLEDLFLRHYDGQTR